MAKKNLTIRRGSTPYITAIIKDNIDLSDIRAVWLTIAQNGIIVLDKITKDLIINNNRISIRLTQADSLSLEASVSTYIQIRLLTDVGEDIEPSYVSQRDFVSVEGVLKDGEITDEVNNNG